MTNEDFGNWAFQLGVDKDAVKAIIKYAPTPDEVQAAFEAVEIGPPLYSLGAIRDLHETDDLGASPGSHGFLFVGCCPSGDQISVDFRDDVGSVWYSSHEKLRVAGLRDISIRVGDDLWLVCDSLLYDPEFPIDYFAAKKYRYG